MPWFWSLLGTIKLALGVMVATCLMLGGLWLWNGAERVLGLAAVAAAQVVFLWTVADDLLRGRPVDHCSSEPSPSRPAATDAGLIASHWLKAFFVAIVCLSLATVVWRWYGG